MKVWTGSEQEKDDLYTFTAKQSLSSVMGQEMEANKSESKLNIDAEFGITREGGTYLLIHFSLFV